MGNAIYLIVCFPRILISSCLWQQKADHITTDQIQNLISLMRQLVQEGGRHVEFEGIDTEYTAIAAIRATKQVFS